MEGQFVKKGKEHEDMLITKAGAFTGVPGAQMYSHSTKVRSMQ